MINWHHEELGENGETLVLPLSGRLDGTGCEYLFSAIEDQIHEGRKELIVDCDGLEFISSVGLGMLLRLHSRMKRHGGEVRLVGIRGSVASVVKLVKLDVVFGIYSTLEEALAARDT